MGVNEVGERARENNASPLDAEPPEMAGLSMSLGASADEITPLSNDADSLYSQEGAGADGALMQVDMDNTLGISRRAQPSCCSLVALAQDCAFESFSKMLNRCQRGLRIASDTFNLAERLHSLKITQIPL